MLAFVAYLGLEAVLLRPGTLLGWLASDTTRLKSQDGENGEEKQSG